MRKLDGVLGTPPGVDRGHVAGDLRRERAEAVAAVARIGVDDVHLECVVGRVGQIDRRFALTAPVRRRLGSLSGRSVGEKERAT